MRNKISKLITIRKSFSKKNMADFHATWDSFKEILEEIDSDSRINTYLIHEGFPRAMKAYKSIIRGQGPALSKGVAVEKKLNPGLLSKLVAKGLVRRSDKSFIIHTNAAFHELCSFVTQLIFALEPKHMASIKTVPATKPTSGHKSRAA